MFIRAKQLAKGSLRQVGLEASAVGWWQRRRANALRRRYEKVSRFHVSIDGVEVDYSTEDYYSKFWFFSPAAADGKPPETAFARLLLPELRKSRGFADLGANLGYFTTLAAKACPALPIHSFEMDATLAPLIERNLAINGCSAMVVAAAVGDDHAPVSYTPHPYSFLKRIAHIDPASAPFRIELTSPTIRMDEYFADRPAPDLWKIDVDGCETRVLRGMGRLLDAPDIRLFVEVHPHLLPSFGSSIEEVLRLLWDRGFSLVELVEHHRGEGRHGPIRPGDTLTANNMLFCSRAANAPGRS